MESSSRLPANLTSYVDAICAERGHESILPLIADALAMYDGCRRPKEVAAYEQLTPRLRQVLRLVADGRTTKQIAAKLHVSRKTVEFHLDRLRRQLGIREIALLTRFAVRVGAVRP